MRSKVDGIIITMKYGILWILNKDNAISYSSHFEVVMKIDKNECFEILIWIFQLLEIPKDGSDFLNFHEELPSQNRQVSQVDLDVSSELRQIWVKIQNWIIGGELTGVTCLPHCSNTRNSEKTI